MKELQKFISDQLSVWPLASANFRSLKTARNADFPVFSLTVKAQTNPSRIVSSTAEVDEATIAARPCFLCVPNRPKEQYHIRFEGRKGRNYNIQVNPYPIFPEHLVIARSEHIPQSIQHHFPDMLAFAEAYPDFTVFYNGPASGASAPDHLHFQACPRHCLPLEDAVDEFLGNAEKPLATLPDASLYLFKGYVNGVFALKARTPKSLSKLFYRLSECCGLEPGESEPRFNLYAYSKEGEYRAFVILRSELRSHHYYAEGDEHFTMSPGAADMAGFFVVPVEDEFDRLSSSVLESMLAEVTISEDVQNDICKRLTRTQEVVEVGIMSAKEIRFEIISDGAGPQRVSWADGRINYNGTLYDELYFDAVTRSTLFAEPSFLLYDVTIGIDFHWEQKRTLKYAGQLKFIVENDKITAINRIGLEDYLLSVISSEMKSSSSLEFLKAHSVISRSWVLARMRERKANPGSASLAHRNFDVCADDHCQRYQGAAMACGDTVRKAIDQTWGQVLSYKGELCDARYSKCCGGLTERYSACWEDIDFPYLQSVADNDGGKDFCDCEDDAILEQVLNDYDLKTRDFYRWKVRYRSDELSDLLKRRTGRDLGEIQSMEDLERGDSGRIISLRIKGTGGEMTISKELAIRRALSESHLKSSNFTVTRDGDQFILEGRGWGHGVGLCQIGAAVMAARGYSYIEILKHYYKDADIG